MWNWWNSKLAVSPLVVNNMENMLRLMFHISPIPDCRFNVLYHRYTSRWLVVTNEYKLNTHIYPPFSFILQRSPLKEQANKNTWNWISYWCLWGERPAFASCLETALHQRMTLHRLDTEICPVKSLLLSSG